MATKKENEKNVRATARIHLGPLLPAAKQVKADLHAEGRLEEALIINNGFRGIAEKKHQKEATRLINEGAYAEALDYYKNNREICGEDINDLICSFPFDGEEHTEPCPSCGDPINFRYQPLD